MGKLGRVEPVVPHVGVDTDDCNEQIDRENAAFDAMLAEMRTADDGDTGDD